jgi:predicted ATPase
MGVKEDATRPQIETLTQALAQRNALIVLDNFEQVVGAARHVNRLLRDAPAPRILCSSREALRISGEQEFPVPPLDDEPAVRLFVQRALQLRPDFAPSDDDLETIGAICRAVDRLPLAIELAAARIRLFPLKTLLTRLTDRLATLESSQRDLPDRQRTLRGAIEWSWELLDENEREVFARLAVFAGGADLEAIEAIIDPGGALGVDVISVLGSLVDKSLVTAIDGPGGDPRYRMLDTIRAFAAERLAASGGAGSLHKRHLDYFVRFAEEIEPQLTGTAPELAFARVDADHDNLRAAVVWSADLGDPSSGFRIGGAIWRFWQHRGRLREGRDLFERLLAVPARGDADARGRGMTGYGGVVYWQAEYEHAEDVYRQALELYREAGDEPGEALALFDLGFTMSVTRKTAEALDALQQSEDLYVRLGDEKGRLGVSEGRAAVALINRDLDQARQIAEVMVEDYRRLGMRYRMIDSLGMLIGISLEQGDLANAQSRWMEWANAWMELGDFSASALVFEFAARMAYEDGRPRDAALMLGALQRMSDMGEPFLIPGAVMGLREPEPDVRAALSPTEFDAAFAEGRAWPRDYAIAKGIELGRFAGALDASAP